MRGWFQFLKKYFFQDVTNLCHQRHEMLSYIRSALRSTSSNECSGPVTVATEAVERLSLSLDPETDLVEWKETIFDIIKDIKDPEKDESLEELDVVRENLVFVTRDSTDSPFYSVKVEFVPTVPHCSLATLIGLCLITKLNKELPSGRFALYFLFPKQQTWQGQCIAMGSISALF